MEYFRQPGNLIQAGFALHAGRLLAQYCSLTTTLRPQAKYDATLVICVLQSLLTNCTELLSDMRAHQKSFFGEIITDIRIGGDSRALSLRTIRFPGM